jgi:hypothetical protein
MKNSSLLTLCLLAPLVVVANGLGQEPGLACSREGDAQRPGCESSCLSSRGLHWTRNCFPCKSCPDDYCPNPYPRQCWPPYPPFYQCAPAGNCCRDTNNDRLSWWFLPRPRALHEALWCQP